MEDSKKFAPRLLEATYFLDLLSFKLPIITHQGIQKFNACF